MPTRWLKGNPEEDFTQWIPEKISLWEWIKDKLGF